MNACIASGCALVLACLTGLSAIACGSSTDAEKPSEGNVAQTPEAIVNGTVMSSEDYNGIVAIQIWVTQVNPPAHWSSMCSGGLMRNHLVVTAKHCLVDLQQYGDIYAKMGNQRVRLLTPYALNPDYDIAIAKLETPMTMWNYNYDHYLTSPPQLTTSGYGRKIYTGGNASLDGHRVICFGYGGTPQQPPLTYGLFDVSVNDGLQPLTDVHLLDTEGRSCEPGDSGMFCLSGLSSYASPLASISVRRYGAPLNFCTGPGADSWGAWLTWLVAYG